MFLLDMLFCPANQGYIGLIIHFLEFSWLNVNLIYLL